MSPPLIPDFPLLTATGLLPSTSTSFPRPRPPPSFSPDHRPDLRDPLTGTAVSATPLSTEDHIRQRLKLVRLRHHLAAADAAAKRRAEKVRPLLASRAAAAPLPPPSVAALTGVPTTLALACGGAVGMAHLLLLRQDGDDDRSSPSSSSRWLPGGRGRGPRQRQRHQRGIPVFAGEQPRVGMGLLAMFDPVARRDRAERLDVMRFDRAVYLAAKDGKRDGRRRCLRCRVRGLPCSFERMRGREKKACEECRRNGCRFCLGVVLQGGGGRVGGELGAEGWRYLTVRKTAGSSSKVDVLLYVREAEEVDLGEVREYAEELMNERGLTLWGAALDAGAAVLPSWEDAYCKSLTEKRALDNALAEERTGRETQEAIYSESVTWKDYFRLLNETGRRRNPYRPREPRRLLPGREPLP